jgi:UDP-N-acetylmuramoyl-L-alanyl-D-glutamate--2,6-diaminopimelate ligase
LEVEIRSLAYDSREVEHGSAFFAIRGEAVDGHGFIESAISKGAAVIVAEEAPPEECKVAWVHVKSSRKALALAGAAFHGRPGEDLALVGVTGTNGKTTSAFLIHHLLNAGLLRSGVLGTIFYDLGGEQVPATHTTPQSLEVQSLLASMRDNGCRACAMEVSSHALHQDRVHGLSFEAAVFTNLTQDHLDYHGTMDAYFDAKAMLFESVADAGHGTMVINSDDLWGRKLVQRFESTDRVRTFGFGVHADYRAINPRYDLTGTSFELSYKGRSFLVRSPLIGDFNVYNTMGAIAAVHAMGLNLRESIDHMKKAPQVPGRLERVTDRSRFQVFVDYAHTPDALVNVLKSVRSLQPNRIITVFGCGGDRDRAKRPQMAKAAEEGSDICVLTTDNPRNESPEAIMKDAAKGFARPRSHALIVDRREAIAAALRGAREGDVVLIAGKGHEGYQEVRGVRHSFDDRKVARKVMLDLAREVGDV